MDTYFFRSKRLLLALVIALLGLNVAFAQKGVVYLVGAGPGDAELITLKGLKALKKADVVLYDALSNPEILLNCRKNVRLVPVGKRAGRPSMKQDEINKMLIDEAKKGQCVVRLKGGDPFVFGRGGEEVLALTEANVEVKVVPGTTAAIAAPAYAGIPVTHRALARSFTLVTASSKDKNLANAVHWKSLVDLGGTLAFYMGARVVPEISQILISKGLSGDTPAAIISNGTLPEQKVLRGKLKDFTPNFVDYNSLTPALFMVGQVIDVLPNSLEMKPSADKKVLAVTLNRFVSELGPRVEEGVDLFETLPCKEVYEYSDDYLELIKSIGFTHFVFSNTSSVENFFALCKKHNIDLLSDNIEIVTLGDRISDKLKEHGYDSKSFKSYNEIAKYLVGDKAKMFNSKVDAISGATRTR